MYSVAHSADPPAMVLLFAGRETSDSEYEGVIGAWERLFRDAKGRPAVGVVVVPVGHAQPNVFWRRRFAEVHGKESGPVYVAVVTQSAVIRGVITAVNWLMRRRANYHSHAFDTIEAAAEKLRSVEGLRDGLLRELLTAAQDQMRERRSSTTMIEAPHA